MSNGRPVKRIDVERFVARLHRQMLEEGTTREGRMTLCSCIEMVLCEANRYGGYRVIPQQVGVSYDDNPIMGTHDDSYRHYYIKPTR